METNTRENLKGVQRSGLSLSRLTNPLGKETLTCEPHVIRRGPYGLQLSDDCASCRLRTKGFFCDLSPAELKNFDEITFISAYPAGAILFIEQQRPRGLYIICEGQVKTSVSSSRGNCLTLSIAESGQVLGLLAAMTGQPYDVTAETLRPCQIAFVHTADFYLFLRRHPAVFQRVAAHLGLQYRNAHRQLCTVGLSASILGRLAKFLLEWSAERGAPRDGDRFALPLHHEQIAECIGTTRESVTRALSELRISRLISNEGVVFTIPDRMRLHEAGEHISRQMNGPHLVQLPTTAQRASVPTGESCGKHFMETKRKRRTSGDRTA